MVSKFRISIIINILVLIVCSTRLPSAMAGVSDKGGGQTTEIKAKVLDKIRNSLIEQLKQAFSNEPAALMSLRSYVASFINSKSSFVKNERTRQVLEDMRARGAAQYILKEVKFVPSSKCVDRAGRSSSAVAPVTQSPPSHPEICVNLEKIVEDEGPDIKDSTLIALTTHELAHFYGYEDASHDIAADIAEFVAGVYFEEDHTLIKTPAVEINTNVQVTSKTTTACAINVDAGLTQSPCTPLEFVNSLGEKDLYTRKEFDFVSRKISFQHVLLSSGSYSRRVIRLVSAIDVPSSTGQLLGTLRQEIAKVVKIENPGTNEIGTIHVEVYPSEPALDFYGHIWKNPRTGHVYDQVKERKFFELTSHFEQATGVINVKDLKENTAYKLEVRVVGKDLNKNAITTPQYFIYFNVRDEYTPPIDFAGFDAPIETEMGRQLTPGFVPFDELAYRDHLKLSIQNYRNVCSAVGPCDGSVAQRTGEAEVKLLAARQFLLAQGKTAKDFHFEKGNYEWATAMGDYQKLTREWNEAIGQGSDLNLDKKKLLIEAISKLISLRDGRVNRDKEGDNWVNNLNREMRLLRYDIERNTENKN